MSKRFYIRKNKATRNYELVIVAKSSDQSAKILLDQASEPQLSVENNQNKISL